MSNKYVSPSNLERYDGKIKEYIDEKVSSSSSSYDDTELSSRVTANEDNIENILDGSFTVGNAEKVNGYTVNANVPADAVFTDTVYDDSGVVKLQGNNTTNADGVNGADGFSLKIKSSDGINSNITLQDVSNNANITSIYPAEIRTPYVYTDNIKEKTSGQGVTVGSTFNANHINAVSAEISWFDGDVTFDGIVTTNTGFVGDLDGTASKNLPLNGGTMDKNANITIPSSNLVGGITLNDDTGYIATLTPDCLHIQDSEGNTSVIGGSSVYSPEFVGNLTGTASKATALANTTAIGSSTKPVYINASGAPTACTYTLANACAKSYTTSVTSGGTNLPTSGAVYTAIRNVPNQTYSHYSASVTLPTLTEGANYFGNDIHCHTASLANVISSFKMNAFYGYDITIDSSNGGGCSNVYNNAVFGSGIAINSNLTNSLVVGSATLDGSLANGIIAGTGNALMPGVNATNTFIFGTYCSSGAYTTTIGHYNSSISGSSSGTSSYAFCIGNGVSGTLGNAFMVTYAGATHADAAYSTSGADYAEYVEWADENPEDEERIAKFVTLHGDKLAIANEGEYIAGVISATPSVIGNNPMAWTDKFLKDEFGRWITEEVIIEHIDENTGEVTEEVTTQRIVNPNYDPDLEYIMREERAEWAPVGMLGFLKVYDDGTCSVDGYCKCAGGGIATAATVDENSFLTPIYRVVNRISENIIEIYFR